MPKVTESIQNFLRARRKDHNGPDLLDRWAPFMETQVNVSSAGGEPVEGKRNTWTDGIYEWHSIRIPKNANADPEFRDYEMQWPLDPYIEGIGSTGWDWSARRSRWVGFDFDSITGHASGVGVTDEELERVKAAARALPWVEVRRSTGGNGLHLYVYFDDAGVPTKNHTEHAALGRAILGMMASETGFDFASQIDVCGGNMWLYHKKMTAENQGLSLIKAAERTLGEKDLPANWKDHIEVVTRRRAKVRVAGVENTSDFDDLVSSRRAVPLDDQHKAVIAALHGSGFSSIWVPDHHLLQTHTCALAKLMDDPSLKLQGFFKTNSSGRDPGTPNCFLFPLDAGGWKVYRFGPGIAEAETWEQDGDGWTTCHFNRSPTLKIACRAMGGIEDAEKGGFVFDTAEQALKAAEALGQTIPLPPEMKGRETCLKPHKDGRLVVNVAKKPDDEGMKKSGWLAKKDHWTQVFNTRLESSRASDLDQTNYDNCLRVLRAQNNHIAGYAIRDKEGGWSRGTAEVAKRSLARVGLSDAEVKCILGNLEHEPWKLVNMPFQPEFPGDRRWNYGAVQFLYQPSETLEENAHPHWDLILDHCGQDLDSAINKLPWAQRANIRTGGHYLLHWAACMFREPHARLPFLFFYGDQNCGKSSFCSALKLLMTAAGYVNAGLALTNQGDFNGEILNGVLGVIEERNLALSKRAYDTLKDWITNDTIWIHAKGKEVYPVPNTLHVIQTANSIERCAINESGDTRGTMFHVPRFKGEEIPIEALKAKLREEAPHFMRTLMDLALPPVLGRLRLPPVTNSTKERIDSMARNPLESFLADQCFEVAGECVLFKDFFERFQLWLVEEDLEANEKSQWNKKHVTRRLPHQFPYGKGNHNQRMIGNISFVQKAATADALPLVALNGRLCAKGEE